MSTNAIMLRLKRVINAETTTSLAKILSCAKMKIYVYLSNLSYIAF